MTFEQALPVILRAEGGVSDDPDDPGGLTAHGITDDVWRQHREDRGLPPKPVTAATEAEVREVYRHLYWDAARCDALPHPLALVVFDAAVNQGVAWATRALQSRVGVKQDGVIGPVTMAAVRAFDPKALAHDYLWARLQRYTATCRAWEAKGKPRPWKFMAGWVNRLTRLRASAGLEA